MQKPIEENVIVMISSFPSFSQPLISGTPGTFFCFHDLIITVRVWSAECVPKLDEKGLVTAQSGSDVLAPHWQ